MWDARLRLLRAPIVQTIRVFYAMCYDDARKRGWMTEARLGGVRAETRASLHFVVPFVVVGGADIRKRFDKRRYLGFHDVTPLACLVA